MIKVTPSQKKTVCRGTVQWSLVVRWQTICHWSRDVSYPKDDINSSSYRWRAWNTYGVDIRMRRSAHQVYEWSYQCSEIAARHQSCSLEGNMNSWRRLYTREWILHEGANSPAGPLPPSFENIVLGLYKPLRCRHLHLAQKISTRED